MIKEIYIKNEKALISLRKATAIMLFAAPILLALFFISGVAEVTGITVGVWQSIDLVISLFEGFGLNGIAAYNLLLRVGLGVTYIVFLVIIIKRIVKSIDDFKKALSEKDLDNENQQDRILCLLEDFGTTFFNIAVYIFIARLGSRFSLNETAWLTFIIGVTVYVIARFFFFLSKNRNLTKGIFGFATDLILVVSALMLLSFCSSTTFLEIFKSIKYVFRSIPSLKGEFIYVVFTQIAQPIFKVVLCFFGLKLIYNIFCYSDNRGFEFDIAKIILKITAILTVLAFIILGYTLGVSGTGSVFQILEQYISIIALAIVARLVFTFPIYHSLDDKFNKTAQPNLKNYYERTDLNKLVIPSSVKMIDDYAYMDNTDINIAYIPKTVIIMGKGVFSGCGGLNDIYCESVYQPENWDKDWYEGCFATIHWGYTEEKAEETPDKKE